jgi:predicted PurR-regulated permease PerM
MLDQIAPESRKPNWVNIWTFVLLAAGFLGGYGVTILTNWNTRSTQLDQVITQMTSLSNDFKTFLEKYNLSHEDTAVAIKDLNKHLEYADRRLDDLEQKVKFGK